MKEYLIRGILGSKVYDISSKRKSMNSGEVPPLSSPRP